MKKKMVNVTRRKSLHQENLFDGCTLLATVGNICATTITLSPRAVHTALPILCVCHEASLIDSSARGVIVHLLKQEEAASISMFP
jgi:hypothetical protein